MAVDYSYIGKRKRGGVKRRKVEEDEEKSRRIRGMEKTKETRHTRDSVASCIAKYSV